MVESYINNAYDKQEKKQTSFFKIMWCRLLEIHLFFKASSELLLFAE